MQQHPRLRQRATRASRLPPLQSSNSPAMTPTTQDKRSQPQTTAPHAAPNRASPNVVDPKYSSQAQPTQTASLEPTCRVPSKNENRNVLTRSRIRAVRAHTNTGQPQKRLASCCHPKPASATPQRRSAVKVQEQETIRKSKQ